MYFQPSSSITTGSSTAFTLPFIFNQQDPNYFGYIGHNNSGI